MAGWSVRDDDGFPATHRLDGDGWPPVDEPDRKGFGSLIMERNPRVISGARMSCHYEPTGFIWRFKAPAHSALAS